MNETIKCNFRDLSGSAWLTKEKLQDKIIEDVKDTHYAEFIKLMERILAHPYNYRAKEFIMQNRYTLTALHETLGVLVPVIGEDGRSYATTTRMNDNYSFFEQKTVKHFCISECRRKTAEADVTVISPGTGQISINGEDILYFKNKQCREQVTHRV